MPRIPYAILKLMNTTRDFSREEHQKKKQTNKTPQTRKNRKGEAQRNRLKVEGRWGKEKGNTQSHRVWPE